MLKDQTLKKTRTLLGPDQTFRNFEHDAFFGGGAQFRIATFALFRNRSVFGTPSC